MSPYLVCSADYCATYLMPMSYCSTVAGHWNSVGHRANGARQPVEGPFSNARDRRIRLARLTCCTLYLAVVGAGAAAAVRHSDGRLAGPYLMASTQGSVLQRLPLLKSSPGAACHTCHPPLSVLRRTRVMPPAAAHDTSAPRPTVRTAQQTGPHRRWSAGGVGTLLALGGLALGRWAALRRESARPGVCAMISIQGEATGMPLLHPQPRQCPASNAQDSGALALLGRFGM